VLKIQSGRQIPTEYALSQNYPNPFNPTTSIKYGLPENSRVTLKIYNVLGQLVKTVLDNEREETGYYVFPFNASEVASGVYYYRLEAQSEVTPSKTFVETKKMLLVK